MLIFIPAVTHASAKLFNARWRPDSVDRHSFYCQSEVCFREKFKQSKPFHVGDGLRQGCVLSPIFFIVYMNWIGKCSQADECATIGNCKISRLLFADDLVLLSSTGSGLQRALNDFADAWDIAEIKISTA